MYPWNCCRTCLGVQTLYPIFPSAEHSDKFTTVIFTATGLKVEINDTFPQEMCAVCINFINDSIKFRKKCEESHQILVNRTNTKQYCFNKIESTHIKLENERTTSIDISDLLDEDNFNDFDDNITLDSYQYNNNITTEDTDSIENDKTQLEFETSVQDIVENPIEDIMSMRKRNNKEIKERPKRKVRTKKENGKKIEKDKKTEKKTDTQREEIECEYCHKILRSRLSLRNHYKIHTGFDVICEHCGKKFITRRLLLMHCRAKHGYEKTDKCSFCDYRASNAEQVKIHERLHTGEKPFVCSECGAGFHRKSSYLQHVAIHLPEKTVQCDLCTARFKSVTLMRIHKNRHRAPQYSFKCLVCDNLFARRRNVVRHLQRIHGLPPEQQHIDRLKIG